MQDLRFDIQNARKAKGLTQQQVAELMGVTLRSYQRYEYGENMPRSNKLLRLAEILGLSVYDILRHNSTAKSGKTETA